VVLHKGAVAPDQEAKLSQADLQGTNIQGANLIGVENLTHGLVNAACVDGFPVALEKFLAVS
jgi:uncharacterized protein YjbI with pentapeptide repeats